MASSVACAHCECNEIRRVKRQGILERWILPNLSLYPFLCGKCGRRFISYARDRGLDTLPDVLPEPSPVVSVAIGH